MKKTITIAVAVFILDAYLLNQGFVALIFLTLVAPITLIRAFFAWKNTETRRRRLSDAGIYFVMAVSVLAYIQVGNSRAAIKAELLIAACEEYRSVHILYPESLTDLVPDFIDKIPKAKYAYAAGQFHYASGEDSHLLWYVLFPPFGKRAYSFETKEWGFLD
jgi:hypothetical protein